MFLQALLLPKLFVGERSGVNIHNQIKSRIGSAEVCSAMGYEINRAGFICCGAEKTPSLKIYNDGGWRCYRCDEGGDCFDLLTHMENFNKKQSLEYCAKLAGVEVENATEVKIDQKCTLKALREAYDGVCCSMDYNESDFRSPSSYRLFLAICCGFDLDNTSMLRGYMSSIGWGWDSRHDLELNELIDF